MAATSWAEVENFVHHVNRWLEGLPTIKWDDLERQAGGPARIAVFAVDLTEGFAKHGNLASERVNRVVEPTARLLQLAYDRGVRKFVLPQDCHPPDSPEFDQYGPHAMCGTDEAETVPELKALPFSGLLQVMPKRSLHPALETELPAWLEREGTPAAAIITGDCTDLCVYQTAMYLKLRATARGERAAVIVPRNCVDTYDLSVEAAEARGLVAHPGELMHRLFLHHMMLNGIEVVAAIT